MQRNCVGSQAQEYQIGCRDSGKRGTIIVTAPFNITDKAAVWREQTSRTRGAARATQLKQVCDTVQQKETPDARHEDPARSGDPPDDANNKLTVANPKIPGCRHVSVGGRHLHHPRDREETNGRYCLIDMLVHPARPPPTSRLR